MANSKTKGSNAKIISLLIAIFIWGYVSIFVNPEITRRINNVPIQIHNMEALAKNNLEITSDIKNLSVDIQMQGTRKSIAKTEKDLITAYVDASSIKPGSDTKIHFVLPYKDLHITEQSIENITLNVKKVELK